MPGSQTQAVQMPPQVAAVFGIVWLLLMGGMIASYVVMLIALWRGMRAHQKIAETLDKIADKLK